MARAETEVEEVEEDEAEQDRIPDPLLWYDFDPGWSDNPPRAAVVHVMVASDTPGPTKSLTVVAIGQNSENLSSTKMTEFCEAGRERGRPHDIPDNGSSLGEKEKGRVEGRQEGECLLFSSR